MRIWGFLSLLLPSTFPDEGHGPPVLQTLPKLQFLLPETHRPHLQLVLAAFQQIQYPEYGEAAPNWTIARNTRDFGMVWSWKYTRFPLLGPLTRYHRINHLPGSSLMVEKQWLSRTIRALQQHFGKVYFDFVPEQYTLPEERDVLQQRLQQVQEKPIFKEKVRYDQQYRKKWLIKSQTHRGIQFFHDWSLLKQESTERKMVIRCVEPFLINGYKFDIGLYVAITSLQPLRVYVHDNVLIRFCKLPYPQWPQQLDGNTPLDAFVVNEYIPPWENEGLKPFYTEIPSTTAMGTNHFQVLKAYMETKGFRGIELQRDLYQSIAKLIVSNRQKFVDTIDALNIKLNRHDFQAQQFFELFRFDFIIDDEGRPRLMEVNQSPNLKPKSFPTGATDIQMKQSIVSDVLQMIATHHGTYSSLPPTSREYCQKHCVPMKLVDLNCWSCSNGIPASQQELLLQVLQEYAARGQYQLLFPEIHSYPNQSHPPMHSYFKPTVEDSLVQQYFSSLAVPSTFRNYTDFAVCITRTQCHDHGNCVNGHCACDPGYDGRSCRVATPVQVASVWTPSFRPSTGTFSWTGILLGGLLLACLCSVLRRKWHLLQRREDKHQ